MLFINAVLVVIAIIASIFIIDDALDDMDGGRRNTWYRIKSCLSFCWKRKWLWLSNLHLLVMIASGTVIALIMMAVDEVYISSYKYPASHYSAGQRFVFIIRDVISSSVGVIIVGVDWFLSALSDSEWR